MIDMLPYISSIQAELEEADEMVSFPFPMQSMISKVWE